MMKRVCNSRFAVCAMLLAVFLLVGGAVAPVCAREDMSAGQAGDPGDGEEIASSGGSTVPSSGRTSESVNDSVRPTIEIALIPVSANGALVFEIVFFIFRTAVRQ